MITTLIILEASYLAYGQPEGSSNPKHVGEKIKGYAGYSVNFTCSKFKNPGVLLKIEKTAKDKRNHAASTQSKGTTYIKSFSKCALV